MWKFAVFVCLATALLISACGSATSISTPTVTSTVVLAETESPIPTITLTHIPTSTFTPEPPTATFTPTPGIGSTWTRPADGMVMVYVPEGEFTMGSDNYSNEQPTHTVYLDAFWMDRTEVTNKMYALCVAAGKCNPPGKNSSFTHQSYYGNSDYDDFPVINVSWNDAAAYCAWAGGNDYNVRLPTEAEWEKAARGTDERTYPWGNSIDCQKANFDYCVGDTSRVGKYESGKSPYGAYDMIGNVWEWVADWYGIYHSKLQDGIHNPTGSSSGDYRVLRGGSWASNVDYARSAYRRRLVPTWYDDSLGFRCSRRAASP